MGAIHSSHSADERRNLCNVIALLVCLPIIPWLWSFVFILYTWAVHYDLIGASWRKLIGTGKPDQLSNSVYFLGSELNRTKIALCVLVVVVIPAFGAIIGGLWVLNVIMLRSQDYEHGLLFIVPTHPEMELVALVWQVALLFMELEEIVHAYRHQKSYTVFMVARDHFSRGWNIVEIATYLCILYPLCVREVVHSSDRSERNEWIERAENLWVNEVLASGIILSWIRMLAIMEQHSKLGPLLAMISRMCRDDIKYFMIIAGCLLLAFSEAQRFYYTNSRLFDEPSLAVERHSSFSRSLSTSLQLLAEAGASPTDYIEADVENGISFPWALLILELITIVLLMTNLLIAMVRQQPWCFPDHLADCVQMAKTFDAIHSNQQVTYLGTCACAYVHALVRACARVCNAVTVARRTKEWSEASCKTSLRCTF